VVVDVVRRITGNTGGIANSFGAAGHFSQELPRRATGGRLPYTGLGTDMILARNRHGVPTAWVDDGEWIIREQMSRKYHNALGLINMDHPSVHHLAEHNAGGQAGRARLGSTVATTVAPSVSVSGPEIDYGRLADTVLAAAQSMPIDNRLQIDNRTFARLVTNANKQSESLGAR
jgi:hypothetical protein